MSNLLGFRCKNCGHLMAAADAGEMKFPGACNVCGHGIGFGTSFDDALKHPHCAAHAEALAKLPAAELRGGYHHGGRHHALQVGGGLSVHKVYAFENWEVLADATPGRLAELGLTPEQVTRHEPFPKGKQPDFGKEVRVTAADGVKTADSVSA